MGGLTEDVEQLILDCDAITNSILEGTSYTDRLQGFVPALTEMLQKLATIYARPEYRDHLSDIRAWISQVERLQEKIGLSDEFQILDVVDYEIRENLKEILTVVG